MEYLNWNEQCEILCHLPFRDWRTLEESGIWKGFQTSQVPNRIVYECLRQARRRRDAVWRWEELKTYLYAKMYATRRRRAILRRMNESS